MGPKLLAHQVSTSLVTYYTPYFLMYGHRAKILFSRIFPILEGELEGVLATQLQALLVAFKEATL